MDLFKNIITCIDSLSKNSSVLILNLVTFGAFKGGFMCILKERNQLLVLHVDNYHLYITAPFTHQNLHLADLCQSPIDFTQEKCVLSNTVILIFWDPMMHYILHNL